MANAEDSPEWYETWAGILAIPTAILTLVGAPILIRKANLEARKTKLEIQEKELALSTAASQAEADRAANPQQQQLVDLVATPLFESRRVQEIILRFIILFLALQAWNFAEGLLDVLSSGFALIAGGAGESLALYLVFIALQQLPSVGYYLIVLGLGGPLLMDILDHFGITPTRLNFLRQPQWWLYLIVALVVVLVGVSSRFGNV